MPRLKLVVKDGFRLTEDLTIPPALLERLPKYFYFTVGQRYCYIDNQNRIWCKPCSTTTK